MLMSISGFWGFIKLAVSDVCIARYVMLLMLFLYQIYTEPQCVLRTAQVLCSLYPPALVYFFIARFHRKTDTAVNMSTGIKADNSVFGDAPLSSTSAG